MSNEKHYPLHPNQSHPPIMTCEIPLEEYESLKRENAELKAIVTTDNSAVIERLSNENERLVKCCKEYDSRQRIDERIKFNGAQQLRATKRALWLLKARYFWILMVYASDLSKVANPSIIHKSNFLANPTPRCMEEYQHEAGLYDNARIKCLNKAEEYK